MANIRVCVAMGNSGALSKSLTGSDEILFGFLTFLCFCTFYLRQGAMTFFQEVNKSIRKHPVSIALSSSVLQRIDQEP